METGRFALLIRKWILHMAKNPGKRLEKTDIRKQTSETQTSDNQTSDRKPSRLPFRLKNIAHQHAFLCNEEKAGI